MLVTGLIIVPSLFLKAGYLLSNLFKILTGSMSKISGMFVVEAVSTANGLMNSAKM